MRVLYIEPDTIIAHTYAAALQAQGWEVAVHHDAAQAMSAADTWQPDVVVMELQLARHNGVDFLYEFRSYSEWQHIPIIVLSLLPPHHTGLNQASWHQLGITAYCYKPHTSLQQLVAAVNRTLPATMKV